MGIFSKKSSTSTTANHYETTNIDKRIVNDGGLVAQDGSSIFQVTNIESADKDIAKAAFDFAAKADATNGEGFSKLLDTTNRLTSKSYDGFDSLLSLAGKITTQAADASTTLSARFQDNVLDAFERAKTTESGSLDQKTIIILAIAAAAALVLVNRKGKA